MKTKLHFLVCLLLLIGFAGCSQDDQGTCEFYFTVQSNLTNSPWTLRVDGQDIGTLTHPEQTPSCSNVGSLTNVLHLTLTGERHQLEAFDATGAIRHKGYFNCAETRSSLGGTLGGSSMEGNCDCLLIEVF